MMTSVGIRVESYVQGPDGELINFDDLTQEQRTKVATELKKRWLNELYRGVATFTEAEEDQTA